MLLRRSSESPPRGSKSQQPRIALSRAACLQTIEMVLNDCCFSKCYATCEELARPSAAPIRGFGALMTSHRDSHDSTHWRAVSCLGF